MKRWLARSGDWRSRRSRWQPRTAAEEVHLYAAAS
jgi:hypothetical protein